MGHGDLLVTQNLYDHEHQLCRPHPRGSVRRASGFVLTGTSDCDLKAVGMIVWRGGNWSDCAPHRT